MSDALRLADAWEHRSYELATELRRLDALVKERAQEIERLNRERTAQEVTLADLCDALRKAMTDRDDAIERLRAQRVPQVASAQKAQFYVRVSNISGLPSGVFPPNADGSAPDVELKSESLVPVVSAQRVPLTEEQIIAANYPDGEENGPTIAAPDFELLAFGRQIEAAVLANHPLQRLADLSKEIGEKL